MRRFLVIAASIVVIAAIGVWISTSQEPGAARGAATVEHESDASSTEASGTEEESESEEGDADRAVAPPASRPPRMRGAGKPRP